MNKRGLLLLLPSLVLAGCGRQESAEPAPSAPNVERATTPEPAPPPQRPEPAANAAPPVSATPSAAAQTPARAEKMYTVRSGETLLGIARKTGVAYQDLIRWNNVKDPDRILVGQELKLTEPPR